MASGQRGAEDGDRESRSRTGAVATRAASSGGRDRSPGSARPRARRMLAFSAADNYVRYMALPVRERGLSVDQFQFTRQEFERITPDGLKGTSIDPDLSRFKARGVKLILYHGWTDPLIPPRGTVDYYAAVERAMGSPEHTCDFARLFMFPATIHRGGGGPAPKTSDLIFD
ncbi:MAG: tannase/feruloyl esterase family alpha/beta hydrolase, partial [Chloroflexi bacterium]|nr:tannase/feruloyl esterase family alpha/beta hydrolase [Chloroflexota bacterium]